MTKVKTSTKLSKNGLQIYQQLMNERVAAGNQLFYLQKTYIFLKKISSGFQKYKFQLGICNTIVATTKSITKTKVKTEIKLPKNGSQIHQQFINKRVAAENWLFYLQKTYIFLKKISSGFQKSKY